MKKNIWILLCFLLVILPSAVPAQAAGEDDAMDYLQYICQNYPDRRFELGKSAPLGDYIYQTLTAMGYTVNTQVFSGADFAIESDISPLSGRNFTVDIPGQTDKMILIIAHYDCADTQGCDDNASGLSVALSLAKNLKGKKPPCTIRFLFSDQEEDGCIGTGSYALKQTAGFFDDLLFLINIDSIAGGDKLYVHGGDLAGNYTWARDYALQRAHSLGLPFGTHPAVSGNPAGIRFGGSDQLFFARRFVPYIYLEANVYSDAAPDGKPFHYQTTDDRVPGHQIMHTPYDDFATIEKLFPGRIRDHLKACYDLTADLVLHTDTNGAYKADGKSSVPYKKSSDNAVLSGLSVTYDGPVVYGETISTSNLHVKAVYSDGSHRPASYWSCVGFDKPLTYGDNVLTFYYVGVSTDVVLTIPEPETEPPTEAPTTPEETTPEETTPVETTPEETTYEAPLPPVLPIVLPQIHRSLYFTPCLSVSARPWTCPVPAPSVTSAKPWSIDLILQGIGGPSVLRTIHWPAGAAKLLFRLFH